MATSMMRIQSADTADDINVVRALFLEYQKGLGISLCFQNFDQELAQLPGDYVPPQGRLLLAHLDGEAVACVALHAFEGTRAEMKRLYVQPRARGHGIGRAMIERIVSDATAIGYREIVLDTLPMMTEAQHLYATFGFVDIPAYRPNPVEGVRYMGLRLSARSINPI
jgi:putative acetyltransferase